MENQFDQVPKQGPPQNLPTEPEVAPPPPPTPPPTMPEPPSMPNLNRINISKPEMGSTPPPVMPSYVPPMPEMGRERVGKNSSILGMIVLVIAVIVIVSLAFLLYYYATKSFSGTQTANQQQTAKPVVEKKVEKPKVNPTKIVIFAVPEDLPTTQVSGSCVASIAQPFREDSYRCTVAKKTYDPCFSVGNNNLAYCQLDPTVNTSNVALVKNIKTLAKADIADVGEGNWGWFVKLRDGTICSPFTGTNFGGIKPVVNGKAALYGCKSNVATEQVFIIGNLIKGDVWKAQKSVVTKQGTLYVEKSTKLVEVDTVWQ